MISKFFFLFSFVWFHACIWLHFLRMSQFWMICIQRIQVKKKKCNDSVWKSYWNGWPYLYDLCEYVRCVISVGFIALVIYLRLCIYVYYLLMHIQTKIQNENKNKHKCHVERDPFRQANTTQHTAQADAFRNTGAHTHTKPTA